MTKLLPVLIFIMAASGYAQSSLPDGPKVNGLGLSAKYSEVVKKFGKPTRQINDRKVDECMGSRVRTLYYPGLKVELFDQARNEYIVFAFEITSPKWAVSGTQ